MIWRGCYSTVRKRDCSVFAFSLSILLPVCSVCLFVCSSVGWEGSLEGGEIGESGEGEAVVFASARVEVEGRHDG